MIGLPVALLRSACADSIGIDSALAVYVAGKLASVPDDDTEIDLDLSGMSWDIILQDIVRRSRTLDYVTVASAFTCSRMRTDGFGGMAVLITAEIIQGKSTNDILEDFLSARGDGGGG